MISGALALLGVVAGWCIAEAVEEYRFRRLYAALRPGPINTTPPTTAELNAQPDTEEPRR